MDQPIRIPTSTHWGNYLLEKKGDTISAVLPRSADTDPSPIGQSLLDSQNRGCRVARPSVRRGYLRKQWESDGAQRGIEPFVEIPWDEALDLAGQALLHTKAKWGNESVYGGSYGWASAGRFHHSQSQIHRFLKQFGGYTSSVQSYSTGTAQVIIPHIFGVTSYHLMAESPTIEDIVKNTRLMVCFGGISMKNTQVNQGGIGDHSARNRMQQLRDAGVELVCVSPLRDDVADFMDADWWPIRPNADVALMLGLAHTLHIEGLHDEEFLAKYCVGYDRFVPYLTGRADGIAKDADWAARLCDIDADRIRQLARRMASEPCLMSISWSLQRTEHGDQPYWMIAVLSAMLGNIGLPGQGVGYGYGCIHNYGFAKRRSLPFRAGALPQPDNPVKKFIPVARIADMLLNPGAGYSFNGKTLTYPEIKLIYWGGGNPFHHHQDLNRLRKAWTQPETVIVNEPHWTATARHADIVFPATTALEREDFSRGTSEMSLVPMHQVLAPYAESRDDYEIFSALAVRLGFESQFTEGRSKREWIRHLWQVSADEVAKAGSKLPEFEQFWDGGIVNINPDDLSDRVFTLEAFRNDPVGSGLQTPSGKIEIFSKTIASFGLADCAGHPRWFDKQEFIGSKRSDRFPLALNSNQPVTRLHSQYDFGRTSKRAKIQGREPIQMHPADAKVRGIREGDVIRVFNDRGACLAGVIITDRVRSGVVVLATGAWFDPQYPSQPNSLEVHGNPNVLTRDVGTSTLSQGTSAHSCLVDVELFTGTLPPVTVFEPPKFTERDK
ncbi:MAG: molybdopterin-dependent oxidoreductase [Burkholderiaceae bacterium]